VRGVAALPLAMEVLVVDDGSTDGTARILERLAGELPALRVASQPHGGKGAAVRHGIGLSRGAFVVLHDADLEYDPADIPGVLEPLLSGRADAVFGTRMSAGRREQGQLVRQYAGNRLLTALTNALYRTRLTDMETGTKAFRGEIVRSFNLVSDDFRIEPELTARVARRGLRLHEVPATYRGRRRAEGKKITWRDGLLAVTALVRFRFAR
jgi:glycosyltransferase involved in cell wall biosynthesis